MVLGAGRSLIAGQGVEGVACPSLLLLVQHRGRFNCQESSESAFRLWMESRIRFSMLRFRISSRYRASIGSGTFFCMMARFSYASRMFSIGFMPMRMSACLTLFAASA